MVERATILIDKLNVQDDKLNQELENSHGDADK